MNDETQLDLFENESGLKPSGRGAGLPVKNPRVDQRIPERVVLPKAPVDSEGRRGTRKEHGAGQGNGGRDMGVSEHQRLLETPLRRKGTVREDS